jgi:putative aldouronate transport system substrate-binding protein
MFQSLSRGDAEGNALVGVVMGWEETDKFGPTLHSQYVPCGPFQNDLDAKYPDMETLDREHQGT